MSSDYSNSKNNEVTIIIATDNTSFSDLRAALVSLGYFLPLNYLYLSIFMATTIIGVFLNFLCVCIFSRNQFRTPLYVYLSYVAHVGIVGNLAAIIQAIMICSDIIAIANTYIGQWLESFVYITLYNMTASAKFDLDIVIVLDRIVSFKPRFKWFIEIKPYKIMLAILGFTIFLNFPYIYLMYKPLYTTFMRSGNNETFTLYTTGLVRISLIFLCYITG